MNHLKSKEEVLKERMNAIHESVFKMGDLYKVRTTVDIPKSMINAFVSKAKKEHGVDPRENWSDTELSEMFVSYIMANFVNIESLPVNAILGEPTKTPGEIETDITPEETEVETETNIQTDVTPDNNTNGLEDETGDMPTGEIEI